MKIAHNNIATTELRIGNMLSGMNCYRTASIFYILRFLPDVYIAYIVKHIGVRHTKIFLWVHLLKRYKDF